MNKIIIQVPRRVKLALRQRRRTVKDAGLAMRCQAVLLAGEGEEFQADCRGGGFLSILGVTRDCPL